MERHFRESLRRHDRVDRKGECLNARTNPPRRHHSPTSYSNFTERKEHTIGTPRLIARDYRTIEHNVSRTHGDVRRRLEGHGRTFQVARRQDELGPVSLTTRAARWPISKSRDAGPISSDIEPFAGLCHKWLRPVNGKHLIVRSASVNAGCVRLQNILHIYLRIHTRGIEERRGLFVSHGNLNSR